MLMKKRLILETVFVLALVLISVLIVTLVSGNSGLRANPLTTPANGTYVNANTSTFINCTFDFRYANTGSVYNVSFINASLYIANITNGSHPSSVILLYNQSNNTAANISYYDLATGGDTSLNGTSNASVAVRWHMNDSTFKMPGVYIYNCRVAADDTSARGLGTLGYDLNWSTNKTIVVDWRVPNLTAVSPVNSSNIDPDSINWSDATMTFSVLVTDENIANCTLYGDFNGTWAINRTIGDQGAVGITNNANNDVASLTLATNTTGYGWYIRCDDKAGNVVSNVTRGANIKTGNLTHAYNTSIYILKVDADAPSLTLSPSASKTIQLGQTQAVSCTQNDGVGVGTVTLTVGGVEQTCSEGQGKGACTATYTASGTGNYVMKCTGTDKVGNGVSSEITLTVEGGATATAGGGDDGGITSTTGVITTSTEPVTVQPFTNEPFTISVQGTTYPVEVTGVTATTATITTGSSSNTYAIGDSKEIDLNNDGVSDLEVTLSDISLGRAVFSIKEVEVSIPGEGGAEVGAEEETTAKKASTGVVLGIIVAIIVILAGLYYFTRKR